ncbi:MAG TPA: hypothetical protein VEJ36_05110 [Nitrososphaerales archaeon]|nr:hypothetical protein [Nitrososphaerales archaeon]
MGRRVAVGATLASAILFGSLLISNFGLVAAAQQTDRFASLSNEEQSVYARGYLLLGIVTLDLLDRVQQGLETSTYRCPDVATETSELVAASTSVESSGEFRAAASAALGTGGRAGDNLTAISPFDGWLEGGLDLVVRASATGGTQGVSTFSKDETHLANLPIGFEELPAVCLGDFSEAVLLLSFIGPELCNSSGVGSEISWIAAAFESAASRQGLSAFISFLTSGCVVAISLSVSQNGVLGPLGRFSWTVSESGTVRPLAVPV